MDLPAAVGAVAEGVIPPNNLTEAWRKTMERRKEQARNEQIKVDPSKIARPFMGQANWNSSFFLLPYEPLWGLEKGKNRAKLVTASVTQNSPGCWDAAYEVSPKRNVRNYATRA